MTTVANVMEPFAQTGDGAAVTRARRWWSRWPLTASADGLVTLVPAILLGIPLSLATPAATLWALLAAVTAPAPLLGSESLRDVSRGVVRAGVVAGLTCWLVSSVVALPVSDLQVLALVVWALVAALAVRALRFVAGSTRRAPVSVLVVGEIGDRETIAAAAHGLSQGRFIALGSVGPEGMGAAIAKMRPEAVLVVPGPGLAGRQVQRLAWQSEALGVPLLVHTRLEDVTPNRTEPIRVGALSLLHLDEARRATLPRLSKQVWERTAAALALLVLMPVFIVLALAVRIDSPGPVFFRQVRVGHGGRLFSMLKFRSMCVDAEERLAELGEREGHVLFKMEHDPRVTRVGGILRRYSLDELPQLLNVALGHMALVGPRPALPRELEKYDGDPLRRLAVAPGLTGLWQVSGRSSLSWQETVRLDLDYVDNWSLTRDVGIVLRTVRAVLRQSGAY